MSNHHAHSHSDAHDHSHDHAGHAHSHQPTVTRANERKVLLAFALTASFMVVEVVGGFLSGSLALIADAGHMLTDAAALALAYLAFRFGRRPPDAQRTFGYQRLEVIAGIANAVALFAIVIWISYEAYSRLRAPHEVLAGPMLAVAIAGLLVNVLVLWILTRGDSEHVNIKGAALHALGDLLGSVGAIAAAIVIYFTGWTPIDPLLSVLVSLLVLRSAWSLLKRSLHILLEGAPPGIHADAVRDHLMATVANLAAVRHVHVWSLTSGQALATLHVQPQAEVAARQVVEDAEQQLAERFSVYHATIAIDWPDEQASRCALSAQEAPAAHASHSACSHAAHG